ncbi:Tubulin polyglutamylase complex subunit 1 [Boothiomyces macroporosus]|uniref:CDP-diacylglycerol--glycerol-3-phosphate 3-phosphatidyltransferase n=1 Tax=Boothiomyces macroporosus TaxID=261099 RepID=A0AAD5ULF9_9FUNG|nr:Tubulin polyglutamylase complex subunit 1 [Boothiomyces macroporosus]
MSATPQKSIEEKEKEYQEARARILGSDSFEQEIQVDLLEAALLRGVEVEILVDYFRGTRTQKELAMIASLEQKFPHFKAFYYQSPSVGPLIQKVMPPRFIEGFGLQHMKIYKFDDQVIISGANLNTDYFENRQDRYMLINNRHLSDYFGELVSLISKYSVQLRSGTLHLNPLIAENRRTEYKKEFSKEVLQFISKWRENTKLITGDTIISPALQIYDIGITQDENAMIELLQLSGVDFDIAAGYLNLPNIYETILLNSKNRFNITTSAPEQNGFFNSRGISQYIPHAYSYLQYQFMRKFKDNNIKVFEYSRTGWTWHAKGLWASGKDEYMAVIGSSNLNYRSLRRDVEAQLYITTKDSKLKMKFQDNLKYLSEHSQISSLKTAKSRYLPPHIKLLTRFIKTML